MPTSVLLRHWQCDDCTLMFDTEVDCMRHARTTHSSGASLAALEDLVMRLCAAPFRSANDMRRFHRCVDLMQEKLAQEFNNEFNHDGGQMEDETEFDEEVSRQLLMSPLVKIEPSAQIVANRKQNGGESHMQIGMISPLNGAHSSAISIDANDDGDDDQQEDVEIRQQMRGDIRNVAGQVRGEYNYKVCSFCRTQFHLPGSRRCEVPQLLPVPAHGAHGEAHAALPPVPLAGRVQSAGELALAAPLHRVSHDGLRRQRAE